MNVYWLEQSEADVPQENGWLSAHETICLESMRFAKRRVDWRLGRWTAKCALSATLDSTPTAGALNKLEIRPAPSGAPEVFLEGRRSGVTISLSHRAGKAICALAMAPLRIGCDLEIVEPRSDNFVADYFTIEEHAQIERASPANRSLLLALLWSAKESALKALREGLRLDTRSVMVDPFDETIEVKGWSGLTVRYTEGAVFHGWWQHEDGIVRTLVADPPPGLPISLTSPSRLFDNIPRSACRPLVC
jgi:4'-phosphopantetheinyl transferase